MNAKKLTQLAMLTGIALIIFVLELQIPNPFPIPGIKLGLANIITVYAVFSGNMMALAYSFTGSMLCLGGMLPLRKIIDENHLWIASVIGAVLHNIGQISVAILLTGAPGLIAYLPFLLVSGCFAGAFTGVCAQIITERVRYHFVQNSVPEQTVRK